MVLSSCKDKGYLTSSGSMSLNSHPSPVQLRMLWHALSVKSSSRNCHSCIGPLPVHTNIWKGYNVIRNSRILCAFNNPFFLNTLFFKFLSADGYCVNAYLILVLNVMYNLCLNTTGLNKDKVHFFSRGDVGGTDLKHTCESSQDSSRDDRFALLDGLVPLQHVVFERQARLPHAKRSCDVLIIKAVLRGNALHVCQRGLTAPRAQHGLSAVKALHTVHWALVMGWNCKQK